LHLGDDVLVPDLAGWKRERLPEVPDVTGCAVVPNWTCEILSPSTATLDVRDKLPLYLRRGVEHVWVIDPVHKLLEVFARSGDLPQLLQSASGEELARLPPFEVFELDLAALWGK
jgi:Uma2 family endonuclease